MVLTDRGRLAAVRDRAVIARMDVIVMPFIRSVRPIQKGGDDLWIGAESIVGERVRRPASVSSPASAWA